MASTIATGARSMQEQFGRYVVRHELGRGGMGVVFLAFDPVLERDVALKVIRASADRDAPARFAREARAVARLDHPHVAQVYDVGQLPDGRAYLAMELVAGRALDALAGAGALAPDRAGRLLERVARAVAHAHERGVIHRDLKPANVLVRDATGEPALLDFGLARLGGAAGPGLTQEGAVLGTPAYMSPEQADGQPATPSTDVYGLGATLYFALTGRAPFAGDGGPIALLKRVLLDPPEPPRRLNPAIPQALEAACLRALAKAPEDRFPSADAFADALEAALTSPAPSRSLAVPVAGGALALLATLGALAVWPRPQEAPAVTPTAPRAEVARPGPRAPAQPAWFEALPPERRPALPLPPGLSVAAAPGEYRNATDGSTLVWVPAGAFEMGEGERRREVRFARGFYLGKYEVTRAQFAAFCGDRQVPVEARRHPVSDVSWHDARAYSAWAGLRLPTQAEWEYGARGADGRAFPWGDEPPGSSRATTAEGFTEASPVGAFVSGASPFGCLDMCGNVCEWVQDLQDWSGVDPGPEGSRAHRGGSFRHGPWECRPAALHGNLPDARFPNLGFRVARDDAP